MILIQMLLQGGGLDPRDLSPEGRGTRAQRPLPQGTKGSDMTDGKVLGWLPRPGVLTQAPGAERGLEQRQQVTSAAPLVGVQLSQPKQSTEQGWGAGGGGEIKKWLQSLLVTPRNPASLSFLVTESGFCCPMHSSGKGRVDTLAGRTLTMRVSEPR